MPKQIVLPPSIYTIYDFFDKTKNKEWKENPFVLYKKLNNIEIKIAKNISNLNFYQADIPISKKIKPEFVIKYLKNHDYRNYYAKETLFYNLVSVIDDNEWIEMEYYNGSKNKFVALMSNFSILFYNDNQSFGQNLSDTKYYHAFKILSGQDNYILRFEIVLSNMDMDQDIDIIIYLNMLIRLLKALYQKFKLPFDLSTINRQFDELSESETSHNLGSEYNSDSETISSICSNISKEDKHTQTNIMETVDIHTEKDFSCGSFFCDIKNKASGIAYSNDELDKNSKTMKLKIPKKNKKLK
jgi:hypothetical protein